MYSMDWVRKTYVMWWEPMGHGDNLMILQLNVVYKFNRQP